MEACGNPAPDGPVKRLALKGATVLINPTAFATTMGGRRPGKGLATLAKRHQTESSGKPGRSRMDFSWGSQPGL